MPTYDYLCQDCGETFEIRASMAAYSEGLHASCPECGSEDVVRKFAAVNVLSRSASSARPSGGCGHSGFT